MDLVGACRVYVEVADRGSFTLGADAAGVPQSVASRRVAALEGEFGAQLFDRSGRRAALTVFGREMLPAAERLVQLADGMRYQAERVRLRPIPLAVPEGCSIRELAHLEAAARIGGTALDLRPAGPAERVEMLRAREVRLALVSVPRDGAPWVVPLGLAAAQGHPGRRPMRLEALRPRRAQRTFPTIWVQPEDDRPHLRDRLEQLGHRAALLPAQIAVSGSAASAVAEVLGSDSLVLSSAVEAAEWGLHWRALAGADLARGFDLAAAPGEDPTMLRDELWAPIASSLGVPAPAVAAGGGSTPGTPQRGGASRSEGRG